MFKIITPILTTHFQKSLTTLTKFITSHHSTSHVISGLLGVVKISQSLLQLVISLNILNPNDALHSLLYTYLFKF